jgi:hypothetical protein
LGYGVLREPSGSREVAGRAMHIVVWEFLPVPGRERRFVEAYGPSGTWEQLFKRAAGYRSTELVPAAGRPGWYRTVDHWDSRDAYEAFRRDFASEYAALDVACELLTSEERFVTAAEST